MTDKRKTIALGELFTDDEIKLAVKIIAQHDARLRKCAPRIELLSETAVREIERRITKPALARINTVTRQENNSMYWAYALEYSITSAQR